MNWYRTLLQVARKMETPQLERLVTDPDVSPTGRAALQLALDERRVARVASESIATMRSQA